MKLSSARLYDRFYVNAISDKWLIGTPENYDSLINKRINC